MDQAAIAEYQSNATIQRALNGRRVAMVGLSSNPLRPSNYVALYLQRRGYEVVPVNPREEEILGARSYGSLEEIPGPVDVVDVFRAPDAVPEIARSAVAIGAGVLWLQFGVISAEGAAIAVAGGLEVVMDRCLKIEHARTRGDMHVLGLNTGTISARRRV